MLGTVVCDALMRHCLSDDIETQHEYVLQCQHTFIERALYKCACIERKKVASAIINKDLSALKFTLDEG